MKSIKDTDKDSGVKFGFDEDIDADMDAGPSLVKVYDEDDDAEEESDADFKVKPSLGKSWRRASDSDSLSKKESDPLDIPAPSRMVAPKKLPEKSSYADLPLREIPERDYHSSSAPRRKQIIGDSEDEYEDYDIEDNSAVLKILLTAFSIIFIGILAVLIYKINTVSNDLAAAEATIASLPTIDEYDRVRNESAQKDQEIKLLNDQLQLYQDPSSTANQNSQPQAGLEGTYTVVSGDSLGKIAELYNTTVSNLMEWNNLSDANSIREGTVLNVKPPMTEE
ncbi:MAG: LysM peptidoglycan-binding domain-containing protein [Clostridiales bacterium]|jgi:LysM repeat protein|nr:LysM peptidoglycan-binding domain-containing protein [Clostridiales bacterium]